jgi:uncharacterized protein YigA (DUF484 family)
MNRWKLCSIAKGITMHNLTYTERARNAYANGNIELSDALEQLAELTAENERLIEKIWDLEDALDKVTT